MLTQQIEGHAGQQAIAAMRAFGIDAMFTLNGGHVWPLYEAARDQGCGSSTPVTSRPATFAAEAYAKLTRRPGLAVLTAGPGHHEWHLGHHDGALQRLARWSCSAGGRPSCGGEPAHCRRSTTCPSSRPSPSRRPRSPTRPSRGHGPRRGATGMTPHRGPTFLDFPLDVFGPSAGEFELRRRSVGRGERSRP